MGDDAVILRGVDSEQSRKSLYSTVHGAGRVMSRAQAKGRLVRDPKTGKKIRAQGAIRHDEWQKWIQNRGVTVLGGDLDEAPQAYRRLPDVLASHAGTIEIVHNLKPRGVTMAGPSEVDPYKD
jgi:tRNA-splicing ligase RtcB